MALVVETGTGSSTAESPLSVADWKAYANARGLDYTDYDDTTLIEQGLRRGTAYVDVTYEPQFNGSRVNLRSQALSWPRRNAYDMAGNAIDADEMPTEYLNAVAEATWRDLQSPGALTADIKAGGGIVQRVKADTVEVEFAVNGDTSKRFPAIAAALATLIGRSSTYSATAVRA